MTRDGIHNNKTKINDADTSKYNIWNIKEIKNDRTKKQNIRSAEKK
jgi:hypothetical protein